MKRPTEVVAVCCGSRKTAKAVSAVGDASIMERRRLLANLRPPPPAPLQLQLPPASLLICSVKICDGDERKALLINRKHTHTLTLTQTNRQIDTQFWHFPSLHPSIHRETSTLHQ